jgi:LysM repeat protein
VPSQGGIISGETVAPFYIVQSGDTLWEIALRFNVSVDALRAINNISDDVIQPGQLLYLPQSSQSQLQPTAIPTSSPQPLPQTGTDIPTVVIPFMPNTGIIKKDGDR